MERAAADALIANYVQLVGLPPDIVHRYPHELSGGMKQRVVIAMALFLEPRVVVLDEPTTALDVIVQAQILNTIKELKARLDLSLIFITHDLATEAEVADRILVMYAGRRRGDRDECAGFRRRSLPPLHDRCSSPPRRGCMRRSSELAFIPGSPPDLLDPPQGCRFRSRCPGSFPAVRRGASAGAGISRPRRRVLEVHLMPGDVLLEARDLAVQFSVRRTLRQVMGGQRRGSARSTA